MTRRVAAAAVVVALGVAAWHLPAQLRRWDNLAAAAAGRSRELPAAEIAAVDPRVFDRAAQVVPRDAVFTVAIPDHPDVAALAFKSLAADALLPRRHTEDVRRARWVLAYRVDPAALRLHLRRVVPIGADVAAAEVAP